MTTLRWLLAISFAAIGLVAASPSQGATIRDDAGMFSPQAIERTKAQLDRLERVTKIPVVIETIDAIPGLEKKAGKEDKERAINKLAKRRDQEIRDEGIFILISKRDRVISETMVRARLAGVLPLEKRNAIRDAFIAEFKKQDFDGGLSHGARAIEEALEGVKVGNRSGQAPVKAPAPLPDGGGVGHAAGGPSTLGTFLMIGLGIVAVLVVLRLLGGLFGRSQSAGYPNQMGGMGMSRPGMGPGPGYSGGPGYGGRGGGFLSGLMGGLGGALAGNWLYDQMSGRHGQTTAGAGYSPNDPTTGLPDQGDDAIIGAEDNGGRGASWDDGGGADTGGGDWGGGGGGGDWGGGGGDWGGGDVGGGGDW